MNGPDILEDFKVGWSDFDNAYRFLNDPNVGAALISEPPDILPVSSLLHELESLGLSCPSVGTLTVRGCSGDIFVEPGADFSLPHEVWKKTPNRIELDEDLQAGIVAALSFSVQIRRAIGDRYLEDTAFDASTALGMPLDEAGEPKIGVSHPGSRSESRIDYYKSNVAPSGFNTHLHGDQTIFTEHGGATREGLRILSPKSGSLATYQVPEGYRLLTRGIDWCMGRPNNYVSFAHAADQIDSSQPRTRWVILWRSAMRETVTHIDPLKVERVGQVHDSYVDKVRDRELALSEQVVEAS